MTTIKHVAHAVGSPLPQPRNGSFELQTGTHHLLADEPTNMAGGDVGPTPFGLLLCGLAACTTMTLRMFAERKGLAAGGDRSQRGVQRRRRRANVDRPHHHRARRS